MQVASARCPGACAPCRARSGLTACAHRDCRAGPDTCGGRSLLPGRVLFPRPCLASRLALPGRCPPRRPGRPSLARSLHHPDASCARVADGLYRAEKRRYIPSGLRVFIMKGG